MIDDGRILDLLGTTLHTQPKSAPPSLLASVLAGVERSEQRSRRFLVGPRFAGSAGAHTWNRRLSLAAAVGLVIAVIGALALLAGSPHPGPVPTGTGTPRPSLQSLAAPTGQVAVPSLESPADGPLVARGFIEDVREFGAGEPGSYLSRLNPWVTFDLRCSGTNCRPLFADELCPPRVTTGSIELPHAKVCFDSVSIIRPDSVDCGTPDGHPDAATLASAMLANATLHAADLGDLQTSTAFPRDLFAEPYDGRVVQILGGPTNTGADTIACNLLLAPTLSLDPIEIRPDAQTTLVLVDAGGSLFVVRAMASRQGVDSTSLWLQTHLLSLIHSLRFIP